MKTTIGGCLHLSTDDPVDRAWLIEKGLIWQGGPQTVALAVEDLLAGRVELNKWVPVEIAEYVKFKRSHA